MDEGVSGWGFAAARLALVVLVGALLGGFVGNFWAGIAGTLSAYLALQLYQLYRLDHWLRHRSVSDPPDAGGLWGDVVAR